MISNGHGFKVGFFFDQRFPLYLGNNVIESWGRIMILMVSKGCLGFFFSRRIPHLYPNWMSHSGDLLP